MEMPYSLMANGLSYTVIDDVRTFYFALIVGQALDESAGTPLEAGLQLVFSRLGMRGKTAADGWFCLSGEVSRVFPRLSLGPDNVNLTLRAPGFQDLALTVPVPQNATFPIQLPAAALHRVPVRIQGRVTASAGGGTPQPGALVWLVDDPAPLVPTTEHPAALRIPLHFAHVQGTVARAIDLTTTGAPKLLTAPAAAGSLRLDLSNRSGLAADAILRVGGQPGDWEYLVIDSLVPPGGPPGNPGAVLVRGGLRRSAPTGTPVITVKPTGPPPPPDLTFTRAQDAGDGLLLLDQTTNADTIQITAADPHDSEYHALGALADAAGYFRLDGIAHQQRIFLMASLGLLQSAAPWTVEYDQPVNSVDLRLS